MGHVVMVVVVAGHVRKVRKAKGKKDKGGGGISECDRTGGSLWELGSGVHRG